MSAGVGFDRGMRYKAERQPDGDVWLDVEFGIAADRVAFLDELVDPLGGVAGVALASQLDRVDGAAAQAVEDSGAIAHSALPSKIVRWTGSK